jgi:hypothetical protein
MHSVKVIVELDVDIVDPAALEAEALTSIDGTAFTGGENDRLVERENVVNDPAAALAWLVDPFVLTDVIKGVEAKGSAHNVDPAGPQAEHTPKDPDFVALFPVCRCNSDSCEACAGFQLTPRTAWVLWSFVELIADRAFNDVEQHGDEPVDASSGNWLAFSEYPPITWKQDAVWRRQAARAFDDLADDLESGSWPRPTCPGEEMALHLVLDTAEKDWASDDILPTETLAALPAHREDLDWDMCRDVFFQDVDILALLDPCHDGIEHPEDPQNRELGMGDYRPPAWFRTFSNMQPRDGRRPFRR